MTDQERAIHQALIELDLAVKSMPATGPKPSLLPLFQKVDDLARALPAGASAQLLHYLQKRSYEKARRWLEDRDSENARGSCR